MPEMKGFVPASLLVRPMLLWITGHVLIVGSSGLVFPEIATLGGFPPTLCQWWALALSIHIVLALVVKKGFWRWGTTAFLHYAVWIGVLSVIAFDWGHIRVGILYAWFVFAAIYGAVGVKQCR